MKHAKPIRKRWRGASLVTGTSLLTMSLFAAGAHGGVPSRGSPACEPLPIPFYSYSNDSHNVQTMPPTLSSSDIYAKNPADVDGTTPPIVAISAADLGLAQVGDDVDGLSRSNNTHDPTASFVFLFSVDQTSAGNASPDPALVARSVTYNVQDQAGKDQQGGDQYLSGDLYALSGGAPRTRAAVDNNTLDANNFDQGGTSYYAAPYISAEDPGGGTQDDVDATGSSGGSASRSVGTGVYYSLKAGSASLAAISAANKVNPSGAHIFYHSNPGGGGSLSLYASAGDLGLADSDDINALIVFDYNNNGLFDGTDDVLFSLAPPDPPSKNFQAADVYRKQFGSAAVLLASATDLGLAVTDNVDALEFLLCDDAFECARVHGIRHLMGDFDDDGDVNGTDDASWDNCYSGPGVPYGSGCELGDFDCDLDVDCTDWREFRRNWDGPGRPESTHCSVPATSSWGLLVLVLVTLAGGTVILSRRKAVRP